MEQPKRLPQQSCTNIISFMLCIAILCMTCYNTISQGRLSGALNKLESKVETIESDIRAWNTRKSKQYYGETNPFHQQDAKTEAKKLEKFYYAGLLEKFKTRLHAYETVSRNNRIATRELRKAFDTLKEDMHSSGRLYHVFGNQNVLVKRRDKRAVGQNGKAKNIPLKLYVPVSLTITENKTLGAIITLRGPPGQKGQTGEKGSSGSRGGRGKAGPQGVKGDKGDFGPKGDIGPIGRTGAKGQKGEKGNRGLKGKEGGRVAVPKIVVPPADQIVLSPGLATFTCEATGSPKPEVTLMPQGKKKDGRYETFGEGTLSIKNVTFADRGVIECVAKSVLGEDRSTAHLIVNVSVKAKATIKAKDIRTESGLNVVINCDVRGFPEPIVSWKRSGKNFAIKTKFSNNNKRVQLVGVTTDDGGDYVCQAVNAHATSLATVSVTVVKRLAFIAVPSKKMVVNAFSNFKIPCAYIGGLPPVRATWQKDGKKLQDKAIISQDFRTLEIQNAKKEDMGKYTCHVRSKMSSISLSVDVSPSNSYLPTCDSLKQNGVTNSGNYLINPSSSPFERPLSVYCDMGGQSAVTVVSHDSEARTRVKGFETAGSYSRKVRYAVSASDLQIKALTRISKKCEQYIKYECTASGMWLHLNIKVHAWWISFTGQRMFNWGGVAYPKRGCACTLTKTCPGSDSCMCDINTGPAIDEGYLRDKDFLPVKELRFGDTGGNGEFGYHTLGKLRCS